MQAFWLNVLVNIVSTLILAFIGFVAYAYLYWKNRRDILHFFGISNASPNVSIYVSTLNVKPGGTTGIEAIDQGYAGAAINKLEYEGALLIQKELKARPLALLPRKLQDWLGQDNIELRTVEVPVKLSPPKTTNRDPAFDSNLIILGTGVYNSLAHYYLKEYFEKHKRLYPWYFYHDKKDGQRIIGIRQERFEDSLIDGRENQIEPAFIQRIHDADRKTTVFICSGLGSSATFGSARYLAEHWKELQRKFNKDEFGVALLFFNQKPDDEFVGQPQVCYEAFLGRGHMQSQKG